MTTQSNTVATATRRRARRWGVGLIAAIVWAGALALPAESEPAQTAASASGVFAAVTASSFFASDHNELPDGRILEFTAYFTVPQGAVTATPPVGDVDLTKPVGALRINALTPYVPGEYRSVTTLCDSVANVTSYDAGRLVPADDGSDRQVWAGAWFDVPCDAGLGFDSFRVHLDPTPDRSAWTFDGSIRSENRFDTAQAWRGGGRLGSMTSALMVQKQSTAASLCGHGGEQESTCYYDRDRSTDTISSNGYLWLQQGMTSTLQAS